MRSETHDSQIVQSFMVYVFVYVNGDLGVFSGDLRILYFFNRIYVHPHP